MAEWKERMERDKKHRNGTKDYGKQGKKTKEYRYYISSLGNDIETMSRAVREHGSVESMHWHLDVTFREDANKTTDKIVAQNQNIIRKWCLSILKITILSLNNKRFAIGLAPIRFWEEVLNS